ncbi:phosphoenolpyruvate--protein phosphotransferase [Geosporobacter ferrireducens]|uniref:Phosphoenolpyruvate-protein phosphotransferase n=1 Tax=Geosporobacter ferrireducens TaxID=1424294 RepID=A0A1D8GHM9_9FIRM|nr:phosphoenolpyruvate--protein phosphotransferase [Geosporobacter ferrireducens]AOT70402.1 phosphoenolpyruvate--protein phosphotransferase [Geosporobacter ferrireducens]MTI58157.1 phosphoenolpyruvate--protein phosphotransferase [Geosporobacter ferrireducens]
MFKGIAASPGIAVGKALVLKKENIIIERKKVDDLENEKNRFQEAVKVSRTQIERIKEKAGEEQKNIMDAHIMILEDPELLSNVEDKIQSENINVEAALDDVLNLFIAMFESMDNEYMKERAADIKDVGQRLLMNLLGKEIPNLSVLKDEVVLVAHDITPSDTAQMDREKVLGFITDIGGRTSHSAIMARSMEIPAVLGLKNITEQVKTGDYVAFDGDEGVVFVNPEDSVVKSYLERKEKELAVKRELMRLVDSQSVSLDERRVEIGCNIGNPQDATKAHENGAEGIGLYRTEFLYMDRTTLPSEDEQYQAYKAVLEIMGGRPVVIRTLDIGGDKELPYMNLPKEANPFLGYRAIRICLDRKDIFKTQLRALLRASVYGNLKIMYPMISCVEEIRSANRILEEVRQELDRENIAYASDFEVGIMIEIPSAAVISDLLADEVDFFSIGTNDLIQYTTAVDRMNEKISHLYNPFNPAVLRLIKTVIDSGHAAGIWVGMCGEVAGDKRLIPILLGMGLDEFSMSAGSILPARKQIQNLSYEKMKALADQVLKMKSAEEIEKFVAQNV